MANSRKIDMLLRLIKDTASGHPFNDQSLPSRIMTMSLITQQIAAGCCMQERVVNEDYEYKMHPEILSVIAAIIQTCGESKIAGQLRKRIGCNRIIFKLKEGYILFGTHVKVTRAST
jgi:hypothetical protein